MCLRISVSCTGCALPVYLGHIRLDEKSLGLVGFSVDLA